MVRQSRKRATPQKASSSNFYRIRSAPARFITMEESSYEWGWTTDRSNWALLVMRGLVIFKGSVLFPLDSSRELQLSGSLEAILGLLILQGLKSLDSFTLFQGLRGVTFRELLESCSTVFQGTYLLPFFLRDDINGFLFFLNYYSFTDRYPLSFSSTQRTLFLPVLFLNAVARILAYLFAPRDSLINFSRPNRVLSMYSSQSIENQAEISIFS